jgi:hypothetical protein
MIIADSGPHIWRAETPDDRRHCGLVPAHASVGRMKPPSPAFGRPDGKLRVIQDRLCRRHGFAPCGLQINEKRLNGHPSGRQFLLERGVLEGRYGR